MPPIKKVITGKMNSDASNELMPAEDFKDGLNVTVDTDGVVSINGNRRFSESYLANGYWCAGAHYDKVRRRVYMFLAHEDQKNRIVVCHLDVEATVTVFENITDSAGVDIFEWDMPAAWEAAFVIKNIQVVHRDFGGDLVYFIDPLKRPMKFNFEKLAGGEYGDSPTLEMFKVIKRPPAAIPVCAYEDDAGRTINNLKKKLFKFRTRYYYADDEKSVLSPISKVPLPPKADDGEYYADGTKANRIDVIFPTGIVTVTKIELIGQVNVGNVWSDPFLVEVFDKDALSIDSNTSYTYQFFNDGVYQAIDLEEANQLFDYVPDEANTMESANGNILVFAGIKEGLDKEVNADIDVSVTMDTAAITPLLTCNAYAQGYTEWIFTLTGIPVVGAIVSITINSDLPSDTVNSTILTGWVMQDIIDDLIAKINALGYVSAGQITGMPDSISIQYDNIASVDCSVTGSTPAISDTDSIPVHKWKGRYRYSLHYGTDEGKTRGVYTRTDGALTVDIPAYEENGSGAPEVPTVRLSVNHLPPSWATHWFPVRSKELTCSKSLMVFTQACDEDSDYGYVSIENLTKHAVNFPSSSTIVTYDFAPGDRIRFMKNDTTSTVLASNDYEIIGIVERTISAVAQDCIKVKKVTGMPSFSTAATVFFVELFSPAGILSEGEEFFYEIGERLPVITDINGNRGHGGSVQSQVTGSGEQPAIVDIMDGDYYFKNRTLTVDSVSGLTETFGCMDPNFSDFWASAVWSQGRPLVIDESIREQYFPVLFRYSLAYQQGTNINELSRFYPDNFEEVNLAYGDVLNLKTRENMIRVFQRFKVGVIPVFRSILIDNANSSNVALSEQVLSKINYYAGDYGIDKYGLSLVSTDYGDYFIDDINRAFVRASLDGITNVSDTFEMRKFFNDELRTGYSGHGVFDYERREVLMNIVNDDDAFTKMVRFSERRKGFQPRYSFTDAEKLLFVEGWLWSMKGAAWVHDSDSYCTFFGEEAAPFITVVFNGGVDFKKNFTNIRMVANRKWGVTAITTSLDQTSNLKIEDFRKKEDGYTAALLRDSSSTGGLTSGAKLKGNWLEAKFEGGADSSLNGASADTDVSQKYNVTLLAVIFTESNLNKR